MSLCFILTVVVTFGLGNVLTSSLHFLGLVVNALAFSGSFSLAE